MKGNRNNHPKKYVRWDDWEAWLIKQWYPFVQNDLPHLKANIACLKRDMAWVKVIMIGLLLAFVGAAIAVILTR